MLLFQQICCADVTLNSFTTLLTFQHIIIIIIINNTFVER